MPLWMSVHKILCGCMFSFLMVLYLRVELLGQMAAVCLTFWGTAKLFSQVTIQFCILTSKVLVFQFCQSMSTLVIVCVFHFSPSLWFSVNCISLCFLFCIFVMAKNVESLPPTTTANYFFAHFKKWNVIDIQHYVSFRCTT